jgi:Flp pilus assembly protein TadG
MSILLLLMAAAFQFGYIFYLYANMQNITRSVARDLAQGLIAEEGTATVNTYADSNAASGTSWTVDDIVSEQPFDTYTACSSTTSGSAEYEACQMIPASLRTHFSAAAFDGNDAGPGASSDIAVVALRLDLDQVLFIDPFSFIGSGQQITRYTAILVQ